MRRLLLLVPLLAAGLPAPAAADDLGLPNRQLVLEGSVDSIAYLEELLGILGSAPVARRSRSTTC